MIEFKILFYKVSVHLFSYNAFKFYFFLPIRALWEGK